MRREKNRRKGYDLVGNTEKWMKRKVSKIPLSFVSFICNNSAEYEVGVGRTPRGHRNR